MDPDPTVPASPSGSPFPPSDGYEEPDSFDPLEPPPLDWRSDSSVDGGYDDDLKDFVDGLDKTSPDPPEHGANRDPTQEDGTEKLKVLANFEGVYEDALNKASPGPSHESPLDPTEQNGMEKQNVLANLEAPHEEYLNKASPDVLHTTRTKQQDPMLGLVLEKSNVSAPSEVVPADIFDKSSPAPSHVTSQHPTQQNGMEKRNVLANLEAVYEPGLNKESPGPWHESSHETMQENGKEKRQFLTSLEDTHEDCLNKAIPNPLLFEGLGKSNVLATSKGVLADLLDNAIPDPSHESSKYPTQLNKMEMTKVWANLEGVYEDCLNKTSPDLPHRSVNEATQGKVLEKSNVLVNFQGVHGDSLDPKSSGVDVADGCVNVLARQPASNRFNPFLNVADSDDNVEREFADSMNGYDKEISKRKVYKVLEGDGISHLQVYTEDNYGLSCESQEYATQTGEIAKISEFSAIDGAEDIHLRNFGEMESGAGVVADEDHSRIQSLLSQLQLRKEEEEESYPTASTPSRTAQCPARASSPEADETTGLLFSEDHQRDAVELLQASAVPPLSGDVDAVVSVSYNQDDTRKFWGRYDKAPAHTQRQDSLCSQPDDEEPEPVWMKLGEEPPDQDPETQEEAEPSYKDVPGPCDPEDLLDGVIFGAKYLGSTQIRSDRNPSTNARMSQAQEAVDRIKAPEGESQPMTEVDLFISTKRIKVLTADTQEAMMDHPLQMISYIADMEQVVVLMARRKRKGAETEEKKKCLMICHVFTSDDAQVIAQAIGQAFGVAYQQFLLVNGIKASDLKPGEYSHYLESQELYNGELAHFCDAQNIKEVAITKPPGEMLGLAVVESGWGSILPTVVVANMLHGGPAERCGELSIGDRIMSVNGTSLVGLPISTCHNIIKDLKSQKYVKLSLVHCPPVTMAIIRRPEPKYQLGFSVEDGIICSLMRGGIAERGGIRVGHRIIEINGQSVVATTHDKIIQTLSTAVGEIHLKTMPASTYRLLTGQEQPVYL
ncbi:unnamed protein product [Knipowitschia caucasica]